MPASAPAVCRWSSAVLSVKSFGPAWRHFCRRSKRPIETDRVSRRRYLVPSIATALLGSVISFVAFEAVSLREQQLAEVEFRARASGHVLILQNGINTYLNKMVALRALF